MKTLALLLLMAAATRAAPSFCTCPGLFDEVCANKDGQDRTYSSDCQADCDGATNIRSGACLQVNPLGYGNNNCFCPAVYQPVCGADKKTYPNQCEATCSGATIIRSGACSQVNNCICPAVYDPVCGADKKTYSNQCKATCSGATIIRSGACSQVNNCICPAVYDPVCGADKKTYSNQCEAMCSGATIIRSGACSQVNNNCICAAVYDPVCGADKKTYSNQCRATCSGTTQTIPGECGEPTHHGNQVIHHRVGGGFCFCPAISDIVCGSDRVTYASPCVATCNSITRTIPGHCNTLNHHGKRDEIQQLPVEPQECSCPRVFDPVCGADDQSFNSPCEARCAGVTEFLPGPCEQVSHFSPEPVGEALDGGMCVCPMSYDIVCGADRRNYANKCFATCNRMTRTIRGSCGNYDNIPCPCPRNNDPVCGANGETYANACQAECQGLINVTPGACFQVTHHSGRCTCQALYAPVCGSDGATYDNACLAGCSNVPEVTDGECPYVQHH